MRPKKCLSSDTQQRSTRLGFEIRLKQAKEEWR